MQIHNNKEEFESVEKSVQEIHHFYLIAFTYVVMMIYLHWLDLKDGSYDWAYWPGIGFTVSLIWFAAVMLPYNIKEKWIFKEMTIVDNDKRNQMEQENRYSVREYESAKRAVEDKIGFYIHLTVYVIINSFLVFLCLNYSPYFWATWPIFGWGIGLFFHGMRVFGFNSNSNWKNRQIQKELDRRRKTMKKLDQKIS